MAEVIVNGRRYRNEDGVWKFRGYHGFWEPVLCKMMESELLDHIVSLQSRTEELEKRVLGLEMVIALSYRIGWHKRDPSLCMSSLMSNSLIVGVDPRFYDLGPTLNDEHPPLPRDGGER